MSLKLVKLFKTFVPEFTCCQAEINNTQRVLMDTDFIVRSNRKCVRIISYRRCRPCILQFDLLLP